MLSLLRETQRHRDTGSVCVCARTVRVCVVRSGVVWTPMVTGSRLVGSVEKIVRVQRAADRHSAWEGRRCERGWRGEPAEDVWSDYWEGKALPARCAAPLYLSLTFLLVFCSNSVSLFSLALTSGPCSSASFLLQGPLIPSFPFRVTRLCFHPISIKTCRFKEQSSYTFSCRGKGRYTLHENVPCTSLSFFFPLLFHFFLSTWSPLPFTTSTSRLSPTI